MPSTVMRCFTSATKMRSSKLRHSADNCTQHSDAVMLMLMHGSSTCELYEEITDHDCTDYHMLGGYYAEHC